jgi:hypothetical protein
MATATKSGSVTVEVDADQLEAAAGELFNAAAYDTRPKLDGHTADKVKIAFTGSVEVDLMDVDQLEHYKSLLLGEEVELKIHASVAKVNWAHAEKGEDLITEVATSVGLKVHSYDLPS